jgi:hypothetical protein
MATIEKIGIPGKQVYSYDSVTGFARMEVTGVSGGSVSAGATSEAAAPTLVEGATSPLSEDLAGNLRVTLGTLISGEDTTNNLLKVSGGSVRQTTVAGTITTNATSAVNTIPTGKKTLWAQVDGTGAVTATLALYGGIVSGVTSSTGVLLATFTLSGTTSAFETLQLSEGEYSFYIVVSTNVTGTGATAKLIAMY